MAIDKAKYLTCVLESHKIRKKQALLDKHVAKRNEIVDALTTEYGDRMYPTFNSGSYAKNTAINRKFDFDLMAPFKRNSFETLEKMSNSLFDFLHNKYKDVASVRKQKVSVGIEFFADDDGDVVKIDVVPGRELNQDQYKDDHKLNLYVYNQLGQFGPGSDRIRSNVQAQIDNIRNHADKSAVREIIRLLKIYKVHNSRPYKSFLIELLVIKAFDSRDISGDLWERLKLVLEFIRDEVNDISLPDPGNSGNDVAESLSDGDKITLVTEITLLLSNVESNSDNIKMYFPVNSEFPCEEAESAGKRYGVKAAGMSIPPPKRFG
jgi:hypothetical protein